MLVRKLGKKKATYDPRTLKLKRYISLSRLAAVPDETDYHAPVLKAGGYPMFGNDQIGDCAIAAPAHTEQTWTKSAKSAMFTPTLQQVYADYETVGGWNGQVTENNPTDGGCNLLAVMNQWKNVGLFGHKILGFASVNPLDHAEVCAAIYLFGGVVIGVSLPQAAQDMTSWVGPSRHHRFGAWASGSWGGHAVPSGRYNATGMPVITWGAEMQMDWAFCDAYCDEMYVAFTEDWLDDALAKNPNGVDKNTLLADLTSIS